MDLKSKCSFSTLLDNCVQDKNSIKDLKSFDLDLESKFWALICPSLDKNSDSTLLNYPLKYSMLICTLLENFSKIF